MDEATFRPLQQPAAQIRASRPPEARALSALRQEYGLPELTPQAVDALRVAEVADLAREMTRRRRRWQVLFTTGINGRGIRGQKGADEARKDRRALRACTSSCNRCASIPSACSTASRWRISERLSAR